MPTNGLSAGIPYLPLALSSPSGSMRKTLPCGVARSCGLPLPTPLPPSPTRT
ncbi:Uncharacterised protein [Mycobacteroides abscessus]|nr:Uncharacterised protein [Mycobacteroides abscessus]